MGCRHAWRHRNTPDVVGVASDVIELHVNDRRTALDTEIEATLRDLVLAHTVLVTTGTTVPVPLPAVREGERWIGAPELPAYIEDLRRLTRDWRRFQSDACEVDDDGRIC
jgi:hypothetical protein